MTVGQKNFTQKKPDQLVYLELGPGNGGMLLTVSEDGFRFRAVSPIRAEGTIPFAFSLDGRNRLEGAGVIEELEQDGKSGGMRFTEVSEEFRKALNAWLSSDSSSHSAGREASPAAEPPLDTMEKIRQELRSGYPQRPAKQPSTTAAPEKKSKPKISQHEIPQQNTSAENRPAARPKPSHSQRPESWPRNRFFPNLPASETEHEEAASTSSAFLKPPREETAARPQSAVPASARFVPVTPEAPVTPQAPVTPEASAAPATHAAQPYAQARPYDAQTRPYIPPLEESFEQAWERAKLTAPPESPRLSRAASGSIIAIALAVILGTIGYNFRQDIGSIFIQMGQSISGENRAAAPPPVAETKPNPTQPDSQPGTLPAGSQPNGQPSSQPAGTPAGSNPAEKPAEAGPETQSAPADSARTAKPNSPEQTNSSQQNSSSQQSANDGDTTSPTGIAGGKGRAPSTSRAAPMPDKSAAQPPADATTRAATAPADSGTGQEEFNAARDILRSGYRQRQLSVAVELLWSGVRKGYVPAEVTLADLYRRGDGVEKNCDQARVLLVAASKKGSFDARQMLEQMAERGCD